MTLPGNEIKKYIPTYIPNWFSKKIMYMFEF